MDHEDTDGLPASALTARLTPDARRLRNAAWAFTTRRVPWHDAYRIGQQADPPRAGDLVLTRLDCLGHHRVLQLRNGRRKNLFPGHEMVVAYGNRYAPNQFEAVVPRTLGPCQLVAGGGVAAKALSWHARIGSGPTLITPIGYVLRENGQRVCLRDHAVERLTAGDAPLPLAIAVAGTAMDAGKTSAAAFLVRGLSQVGVRVGYAKVTGTGAGGDTWLLKDAGADPVLDFTDAGFVSTYRTPLADLETIFVTLIGHLARAGVDVIMLEIADGVLQTETAALLDSGCFKAVVGGVFFAAGDAMGAVAGVTWLSQRGLPVVGLGGVFTAAPLQRSEAFAATGIQTFTREELAQPHIARAILARAQKLRMVHGGNDAGADGAEQGQREPAARA